VTRHDKAQSLLEQLLRCIVAGDWAPGDELPTVRQLERRLAASRVTLVEALRRAADADVILPRARRPAVLTPDAAERARSLLRAMRSDDVHRRVALLVPQSVLPLRYHHRDLFEAHLPARAAERHIDIRIVPWPIAGQQEFVERLIRDDFGAALAMGVKAEHLLTLHLLRQHRFPVLVFNRQVPDLPFPSIAFDEYAAAQRIAHTLADLGHRNLCLVYPAYDERLGFGESRVNGWIDFLHGQGLLDHCAVPVYYVATKQESDLFAPLLRLRNRPTAIVFGYVGLWKEFVARHPAAPFRVPQDVSLAVFNYHGHTDEPAWCPPVAAVMDNVEQTAERMADMLDRMLGGQLAPGDVVVQLQMMAGPSIGPAPQ